MTRRPLRTLSTFFCAALLLTLAACGARERSYEAAEAREVSAPRPPAPEVSASERFGMGAAGHGHGAMGAPAPRASWQAQAPQGWEPLPPAPMRELGWRVAGDANAECTFSTARGQLVDNVNRWRGQMGLDKVDAVAVAALAKKTLAGQPATFVELIGTYRGMGDRSLEGAKLVGLIAELPATSLFLKMTGPASVVDAQVPAFLALADSIRRVEAPAPPPASPTPSAPAAQGDPAPFRWTAPAGWKEQGARTMRVVTFVPDAAPNAEVFVSILGGAAGGTRANVDRWYDQMNRPHPTDAEFAALPRAQVLGKEAVFVEVAGSYSGMAGGDGKAESMLLGMVLERGDHSVFVKMTGPAGEVAGERERFRAFCESFHE